MEEKIYIKNNELLIEGLIDNKFPNKYAIICHPHSLMGGSMYNNVVEAIKEAFSAEKYSTLRFNFRGVGQSTGYYDAGSGEKEDILAVRKYLLDRGVEEIIFAGYSFGSWVGSKILEDNDIFFTASLFISPPINFFEFNFNKLDNKINVMICGDEDQFCDIDLLKKYAGNLCSILEIISGADHFYYGKEKKLVDVLRTKINDRIN